MNYIITLNINNYLCDNARNSMMDACKRWNCEFYEITENLVGDQNICFNKIVGIKQFYLKNKNIDRVLYLDADVLIRNDTPSPFELFSDNNKVYAVGDYYNFWDKERSKMFHEDVTDPWLLKVHDVLKWNYDINELIKTCNEWFFNAGMFLLDPRIDEIDLFIKNIPLNKVHGRIEQAMWNYILKYNNKVNLINNTWNRINPPTESNKMEYYIYHFTGERWHELSKLILNYNWKLI